jgi:hypothetical protein
MYCKNRGRYNLGRTRVIRHSAASVAMACIVDALDRPLCAVRNYAQFPFAAEWHVQEMLHIVLAIHRIEPASWQPAKTRSKYFREIWSVHFLERMPMNHEASFICIKDESGEWLATHEYVERENYVKP